MDQIDGSTPKICLVFHPEFPAESVAGRQFELVVSKNKLAWQLGRGDWCWPRFIRADQKLSRLHCTIYWNPQPTDADPMAGNWEILDGGIYPPHKRQADESDQPRRSSLGVWLNQYQLTPDYPEPLKDGDFISLAALDKARFYITSGLNSTVNPEIWNSDYWPKFNPGQSKGLDPEIHTQLKKQVVKDELLIQPSEQVDTSKVKGPIEVLIIVLIDFFDWIQHANTPLDAIYRLMVLTLILVMLLIPLAGVLYMLVK